jgi:hypothetical protein
VQAVQRAVATRPRCRSTTRDAFPSPA